jgi:SAM-dependent methyltransferase
MSHTINSTEYWEYRFASGDWEQNKGRWQTTCFAKAQLPMLRLPANFAGSILDFGCGLGDALPLYRKQFPEAVLMGMDISDAAIEACRKTYGQIATFIRGDSHSVPEVDVIVTSNVLEHIADDRSTVDALLSKCSELYVFVPYKETPLCSEHVNRYTKDSFACFEKIETQIFCSPGWSQYGRDLWIHVYLKNRLRPFLGKRLLQRKKQIMFRMKGALGRVLPSEKRTTRTR